MQREPRAARCYFQHLLNQAEPAVLVRDRLSNCSLTNDSSRSRCLELALHDKRHEAAVGTLGVGLRSGGKRPAIEGDLVFEARLRVGIFAIDARREDGWRLHPMGNEARIPGSSSAAPSG